MKDESILIQYVGNTPKLRVIDFLIDNMPFDYSKKEIIEGSGISKTTFFNIWKDFVKFRILKSTRKYGKTQLYTIDKENTFVRRLLDLELALANEYAERIAKPKAILTK
ncbi:MAG: hypothetical protein HYT70_01290 [Candidatus Aenigmarchaeota archaeon]|nr:hypothetical protein [Candidatus Aenigmarchaeota archaeon]